MMENLSLDFNDKCKTIENNLKIIQNNVAESAIKSGRRPEDVTILAATKTVPYPFVNFAISKGIKFIGENRVQELISKYDDIEKNNVDVQFIGHLQSNKVKQIVGKVSTIQSVDNIKLAKEISKYSLKQNIITDIFIEVNIGREETKSGVYPEQLNDFIRNLSDINGIDIKGLMAIPPKTDKKSEKIQYFEKIHQLLIDISHKNMDNINIKSLSMGMSNDYQEAIACGATMIRVGRALFGERSYT